MEEKQMRESFDKYNKLHKPKVKLFRHCVKAFLVGGTICCIAQGINDIYIMLDFQKENVPLMVTMTMVFIGAVLTGIGIYDRIGEFAGAGSIVPITGFANSIVSPAMEYKREGFVFGVGRQMFSIAGPVLIYGISSSVLLGIIYYFVQKLM